MNQLCRVCGEPAAGFHFGAFTCEGCKSFFGRTCNNVSSLGECKNGGQCVITRKNRTTCKSCRLRKCLGVGMSKSGSRYGRRSNWFKIHCLMQDQTEQNQQTNSERIQGNIEPEEYPLSHRPSSSSSSPITKIKNEPRDASPKTEINPDVLPIFAALSPFLFSPVSPHFPDLSRYYSLLSLVTSSKENVQNTEETVSNLSKPSVSISSASVKPEINQSSKRKHSYEEILPTKYIKSEDQVEPIDLSIKSKHFYPDPKPLSSLMNPGFISVSKSSDLPVVSCSMTVTAIPKFSETNKDPKWSSETELLPPVDLSCNG